MLNIVKILALIFSSGFSAGLLVTSLVFVPGWRDLEPTMAIDWFSHHGLTLGIVMLPMGILALIFFLIAAIASYRMNRADSQTIIWLLALLAAIGSMVLLATYFSSANTLFFDNKIDPGDVSNEIDSWSYWNWVRTTFSLAATTLAFIGLAQDRLASLRQQ